MSSDHKVVISRVEGVDEQRRNGLPSCVWIQSFSAGLAVFWKTAAFHREKEKEQAETAGSSRGTDSLAEGSARESALVFSVLLISYSPLAQEKDKFLISTEKSK